MAHTLHAEIKVIFQCFFQTFFVLFANQAENFFMLSCDPGKIGLCCKIQHPETGIMKLLCLKHIPQFLPADRSKPDRVKLCVHMVKLLRFKSRCLDQGFLHSNGVTDFFQGHRILDFQKIPQHHGLHCHTHVDHLFDVVQT